MEGKEEIEKSEDNKVTEELKASEEKPEEKKMI